MMDPIKNLLSRRMPNMTQQARKMAQGPTFGLNQGGVRTGAAKRAASYGRKLQRNAPDATQKAV
jgi:hypothetical protein